MTENPQDKTRIILWQSLKTPSFKTQHDNQKFGVRHKNSWLSVGNSVHWVFLAKVILMNKILSLKIYVLQPDERLILLLLISVTVHFIKLHTLKILCDRCHT